jgi:hypothetical protein
MAVESDFDKNWGFASEIKELVPGATSWEIFSTGTVFSSGRKKVELKLYDIRGCLLETRVGMMLTSKRTNKDYSVFRKTAAPVRQLRRRDEFDSSSASASE